MIEAVDLKLDKTCESCPEQYNVYYDGQQIGYIRRRWDKIWAHCPNVFGEVVHEATDDLMPAGLKVAVESIVTWFNEPPGDRLCRMVFEAIQRTVATAKNDGSILVVERARDTVIGAFRCYQDGQDSEGHGGFYTTDLDDANGFYGPIMWDEIISVSIKGVT